MAAGNNAPRKAGTQKHSAWYSQAESAWAMNTLETIQHYAIESYAKPGSNMEERSAYQFSRQLIAQAFTQWVGNRHFDCLIDIGSSTGFLTKHIKHHATKVVAVDANAKVLAAIDDPDIATVHDCLPLLQTLPNDAADVIVSTDTLYYLSDVDLQKAVKRLAEILRPGGHLIFNDNGQAPRLSQYFDDSYTFVTTVQSPVQLKSSPDFDKCYWLVEARYLFCRGLFNALKDPNFDIRSGLAELSSRALVQTCLRYRWIEHLLWLSWLPRKLARLLWANEALLRWFCVANRATDCLWVYQKSSQAPASQLHG